MDVQGINNSFYNNTLGAQQQKVVESVNAEVNPAAANNEIEGVEFVKSEDAQGVTYDKSATIEYIKQAQEARMTTFKNMVQRLLTQQNEKYKITMPDFKFSLSEADVEAAKAAIAEGGEWSVGAVSGRIMEMAQALADKDSSKIGLLKEAVIAGFNAAKSLWGKEMPEITGKTYDAVMEAFDKWESEAKGEVAEVQDNTEPAGTTDLAE